MIFIRSLSYILCNYNIAGSNILHIFDYVIPMLILVPDSNLSSSPPIEMISSKMFKVVGLIMCLSKNLKLEKSLKSFYYALVNLILEYRTLLCDSYTVSGSNQLECVH